MICNEIAVTNSEFKAIVNSVMQERRKNQLRTAWIKNVIRIEGKTLEQAVYLYDKIKPYDKAN